MQEVLVNSLGGLSLPRKSVVRLTDHPDMTLDVYRGRKTIQPTNQPFYGVPSNNGLRKNTLEVQLQHTVYLFLAQKLKTGI